MTVALGFFFFSPFSKSQAYKKAFSGPLLANRGLAVLVVNKRNVTKKLETWTQLWQILIYRPRCGQ